MTGQIGAGSVVQLKSGGPIMTVRWTEIGTNGAPFVCCDWFVEDKPPWTKETGTFPVSSLKLIER
jgi:uncharacterized protein YodC (DUF2158 family)